MQVRTRVVAPRTLLPRGIQQMATEVFTEMEEGLRGADVVMMLRLQHERANGRMIPSVREYYRFYGLDAEKLALPDAAFDVLVAQYVITAVPNPEGTLDELRGWAGGAGATLEDLYVQLVGAADAAA